MASRSSSSVLPAPAPSGETSPSRRQPAVAMFGPAPTEEPQVMTPLEPMDELGADAAGWGSPDLEPSGPLEQSEGRLTSSKGSSGSSVLNKDQMRETIRGFVKGAGEVANEHLTRDQLEHDAGLYLADDQDAEGIGDPLANLAHRHGLAKVGDPDTRDAIMAAIALGKYLWKQWDRWKQVRAVRQAARAPRAEAATLPVASDDPTAAAFAPQEG